MRSNLSIENLLSTDVIKDICDKFDAQAVFSADKLVISNHQSNNSIFISDDSYDSITNDWLFNWPSKSYAWNLYSLSEIIHYKAPFPYSPEGVSEADSDPLLKQIDFEKIGINHDKKRWALIYCLRLIKEKGNELLKLEVNSKNQILFSQGTSMFYEECRKAAGNF